MSERVAPEQAVASRAEALVLVLRRDRAIVLSSLLLVAASCWFYILLGAGMDMDAAMEGAMAAMSMPMAWTFGYAALVFFMWWIMMIAMMLPSAAPMVLLFARVSRQQREQGRAFVSAWVFASGYLLVWGAFSFFATSLQWGFEQAGWLSMMMESTSHGLSAAILIAAGLWQLTPLKLACLKHCRSPFHFMTHKFRRGTWGALFMGVEHGAFCFGCCWFLMALLFYGGVMNLYWIAGLALYVLVEKLAPYGEALSRLVGVGLVLWGGGLLLLL